MVTQGTRYRDLLALGEFRAILASQLVSLLGDVVASIALMVLVYQRTHSSALSSSVMALSFFPYLIGGGLLGGLAERHPARQVLVGCNLVSAGLVGLMAIPGVPVIALLSLLFVVNLFAPVFSGTRSSTLPEVLAPGATYILGRSMLRVLTQCAQVVGYALGGLLLTVMTPGAALAVDAASFVVSAGLLRFGTPLRAARGVSNGSLTRESLRSMRAVLAQPDIRRVLLLSWLIPACAVAPEALATPYVVHLGEPARSAGYLLTGLPVGAVVGELIVGRALSATRQRRVVVPSIALVLIPLVAFVFRPGLVVGIGLLVLSGLGFAYSVGQDAALIEAAPEQLRTRALAVSTTGLMFLQGVGFALWGVVGEFVPLRLVIAGAGTAGLVLLVALRPNGNHLGGGRGNRWGRRRASGTFRL